MLNSDEVLTVYEAMVELSTQMVDAAATADWERLIALEQRCAAHVQALRETPVPALEGGKRQKKAALIRQMLDDDRQIRDLTMPWMNQLSALISSAGTERRLAGAYGAA